MEIPILYYPNPEFYNYSAKAEADRQFNIKAVSDLYGHQNGFLRVFNKQFQLAR